MEELIRKIEMILIETGQHDLKFKLGEIIKYSPTEVGKILRKHKDELRQGAMKSMNNDDTVSRKAVLDAIMGEPTDAHYPSWYAERIKALPPSHTVQSDPDTISRKQANDALKHDATVLGITPYDSGYTPFDAIITLHTLPPSPTPSRPQGYWKGKPIAGFTTVRCSCCGMAFCENDGLWKYCPECGADMRGVEHE